ncbi:MAG TPA: TldD/PmbA family protein [Leptospiraceae bacterium]|nr:TldD/PmbA family protein [Leptospiraceae bacterium]
MTPEQLHQIEKELQQAAREALGEVGRADGEICCGYENKARIIFEGNEFSLGAVNEERTFGVRVIDQGRMGFSSTNQPDHLLSTARVACEIARLSPASEFHCIPDGTPHNVVSLIDSKLMETDSRDAGNLLEILVKAASSDKRVTIDRAEIALRTRIQSVLNSKGVYSSYSITTAEYYIMGMARDGEEVTSFDYDGGVSAQRGDLESQIETTGLEFRSSVIGSLHPIKGKSTRGAVLLHPRAVSDLFGSAVFFNTNARMHQDLTSSWRDKLNQSVAHPSLMVTEHPLARDRAEGFMPFDREGVPASDHAIIDGGRLNFVAHNSFTARRGRSAPTGNASGSPKSMPGIGFSNTSFGLKSGSVPIQTESEWLDDLKHALLLVRFSGNDDPVSGEFSGVAKNSSWIEHGALRPASEVMISGNVFDLLKNIAGGTAQVFPVFGGSHAPYILVEGVSITAGNE